jgi:ribosomal protein S18 acetylase RimI-like enzyme
VALLLAVEREVACAGFEAVTLEVLTANERAARLYRRWGYEVTWQGVKRDGILAIDLHKTATRKGLACARRR